MIIGKNGITEGVIEEIKRRLKAKGVIKVKMLKTALATEGLDRREAAGLVARLAGAKLMGVRGRTFVLASREQPWEGANLNSRTRSPRPAGGRGRRAHGA
ncbi:YhbY family RNA-binding protein [Stetteria hydrogenophila]